MIFPLNNEKIFLKKVVAEGVTTVLVLGEKSMWNGRRYHSLDYYLKENFGEKLYKLSLDGGMTCPNRDGKISFGGCIFCSGEGSGDFSASAKLGIDKQIEYAKSLIWEKFSGERYIAYFQAFTNTYASSEYLKELFMPVILRDDIAVLDIATRPDCLESDKISLLSSLAKIKPVWVELGLQSSDDKTAEIINRGYRSSIYPEAVKRLHDAGVNVITHMILGLPFETKEMMLKTAKFISDSGSDGIKLQLLHILRGTELEKIYEKGEVKALREEEYIDLVCSIIEILPPEMVIHRLTGDGDKKKLIAPLWSKDKKRVLNLINHELKIRKIVQGGVDNQIVLSL